MDLDFAFFGLSAERLAELTDAHVTTARRWLRTRRPPLLVSRCLCYLRAGELGALSAAWRGWVVRHDRLISPEGVEFTPGEVRAAPVRVDQVRELQRQLAAATLTVDTGLERLERVAVLAQLQNAMSAAQRAVEALAGELTEGEQNRLFEQLDSTRRRRQRAGYPLETRAPGSGAE